MILRGFGPLAALRYRRTLDQVGVGSLGHSLGSVETLLDSET